MSVIVEDAVVEEAPVNGDAEVVTEEVVEAQPDEMPEGDVTESPDAEPEKEDAPDEVTEAVDEAVPVTFDTTVEIPILLEKVNEVLDKYELPQEVSAAFDALKAKAEAVPDGFAPYADYGDEIAVKTLLDRQAYIDSVQEVEPGVFRPTTDKFAQDIYKTSPDKASWLCFDFNKLPSDKYQGLNKFEEGIVDAMAIEGDTVQSVMTRYHQTIQAVKNGVEIASDAPAFIPVQLRDAYWRMPKEERDEIDLLDPALDTIEYDDYNRPINKDEARRNAKLAMLADVQDGINSKKQIAQTVAQEQAQRMQAFNVEVQTTQEKFYNAFRESVTQDVIKNVKFSDNPKMQAILANQNVAFLGQCLEPTTAGEQARAVLAESGIKFDFVRATQLQKDVEIAAVALAQANKTKDAQGNPLNPVELNKATSQFKKITEAWQKFAKDILDQEARLVSTGTAEAVKAEVAKIKVAPKARATTKGVGTTAKAPAQNPFPYGTPQYYEWYADRQLEQQARKAQAYA